MKNGDFDPDASFQKTIAEMPLLKIALTQSLSLKYGLLYSIIRIDLLDLKNERLCQRTILRVGSGSQLLYSEWLSARFAAFRMLTDLAWATFPLRASVGPNQKLAANPQG